MKSVDRITDPGGRGKPTVLVADDDESVLAFLDFGLRQQGFEVTTAAGGPEAVALYGEQPWGVDLVLLDVVMPGLDGPAAFARLRECNPAVRCCFLTAGTDEYSVDELFRLGALRVLSKSARVTALAQALWEVVDGPAAP